MEDEMPALMMSGDNELEPFEEKITILRLGLTLSLLSKKLATGLLQLSQILSNYIFLHYIVQPKNQRKTHEFRHVILTLCYTCICRLHLS